jgi:hypothetical protein
LDAQKGKEKANNKEKSQVWSQLLAVTNGRCRHKYKIKREIGALSARHRLFSFYF